MTRPDSIAYPPRALRADAAARYLGMSKSKFFELVEDGRLPKGAEVDAMRLWDRLQLDLAFEELMRTSDDMQHNSFDKIFEGRK